ncbi:DNA methyltransferase [Dyella thiooxydans]|uniref:DNA methyltransferase n=1 Tax=Dyella thiooxydans TaxID=445710 RepID=UPI0009FE4574|nr:site-specific DNA-methyltransferase [Dyella thiooxydans]
MPWLEWNERNKALTEAAKAPYRLMIPNKSMSYGEDSENMLIEGDNLEALKALLPYYAGKVKCVYGDPPFNTKQAFKDFDDNVEHSIWLSMIYPALTLQRELLSEDGTLFLHIDDNELGYLIAIADEVMGRKNRIAIVTFKQGAATGHKSINPGMVNTTNFLLVYSKNKSQWKPNRLFTGRERDKRYGKFLTNPNESHEKWKFTTLSAAISNTTGMKTAELKKEYGEGLENFINDFVISHANQVAQFVRPDYNSVSADAQQMIDQSLNDPNKIFRRACPRFCVTGSQAGHCRQTRRDHESTQTRGARRAA